jgi:D-alanine transaminase
MTVVYLNGEYLPLEKAQVSVLDRGFLFGDGVYEVIPFYQTRGVGLEEHMERLEQSLAAVQIHVNLTYGQWLAIFDRLISEDPQADYKIYLQVTRGSAPTREFAHPDASVTPTIMAYAMPFNRGGSVNGINTITHEDLRWSNCYIKSLNLLPSCLATEKAKQHDAQEAILYRDHLVTEGASSNVFIVKNNKVFTTPATPHILNGVTRRLVLKVLQELNIAHSEQDFSLTDLQTADEVWITSSTREIAPVIAIDGQAVNDGKPGHVWKKVYAAYQQLFSSSTDIKACIKNLWGEPESVLKFPCDFPIKIMGKNTPELKQSVIDIIKNEVPDFDPETLTIRLSNEGKYLSITVRIWAQSKEQLDSIYRALTANPLVLMAL